MINPLTIMKKPLFYSFLLRFIPVLVFILFAGKSKAALNGTYTIDPKKPASSTNYQNFASATGDLANGTRTDGGKPNGNGVLGAVTFNIANGTYSEQLFLLNIDATSGSSITFQSDSGDSSKVIIAPVNFPAQYYLQTSCCVYYSTYINFTKITLKQGPYCSGCIGLNSTSNIIFRNCVFQSKDNSSVVFEDLSDNGNIVIFNNIFTGGGTAIHELAGSSSVSELILENNLLYSGGINIEDGGGISITGNIINKGIVVTQFSGQINITGNQIFSTGTSIDIESSN